jgi:tripartite-type tricarboxylate transporter receptor subunit TctC
MTIQVRRRQWVGVALAAPTFLHRAEAQEAFPSRPIRLVVPFPPGGSTDVIGRIIAAALQARLGQSIIVENRPGAAGAVGSSAVVRAPADGYTLLFSNVASQGVMPAVAPRAVDYDPIESFTHIGMIGVYWAALVVHPSFPAQDLSGFVAEARRRPGKIDWATSGVGSTPHLLGEMMKLEAGIDIVHVPYRGSGPALTAVLANEVPAMFDSMPSVTPHLRSGALRALGVSSEERLSAFPDLPTFKEQGLAKMALDNWYGISGPPAMPAPVAQRIALAMEQSLSSSEVQERLRQIGLEAKTMSGAPFKRFIGDQYRVWSEAVKATGVTMD